METGVEYTKLEENEKLKKCLLCEMDFSFTDYCDHYSDCREKNTVSAIDIRRNQTYIMNGKSYTVSGVEKDGVHSKIVKLYCHEDKAYFQTIFRWDERFRVDEKNNIIID